jgi:mannose-6-phosphate isomerase-like protein (cupin superfamily)
MQLGDKLKAIRLNNGMTLAGLSARAGVSKSMLSRVERNDAAPTITTLQKMADALGVDLARLVDDAPTDDPDAQTGRAPFETGRDASLAAAPMRKDGGSLPVSVVRTGQRKKVSLPWGANYDMLTLDLQRRIEFILITYPVNGGSGDLYSHEGEECGFVVEGRFRGVVGDQEFTLETGDSIYYSSSIPHRWENAGDVDAKAVWAITPPSFLNGIISD